MANTKVTQHVIADDAITTAMITDANVTPAKLHGTLDLSSKTITLPAVAIPSASTATTQSQSDGSTKVATTAYVDTAVSNLVDSSPSSLNTLNELAAALNDDASFSSTVTTSIATKLPLAGGTLTGNLAHAGDFTLDVGGDITLDAGGGDILLKDDGTLVGTIGGFSGNNVTIKSEYSDGDVIIQGNDGGSGITALTLDMSAAGFATFNDGASFSGTGALKLPVGTTGQRPTAATGQIRWNSTDGALEVYNGSAWTAVGTGSSNKILDTFTGDGSTAAFTLTVTPANEDALMVFIDGVYQEKGDYSLSSAVLTLDTAPASGEKVAVHTTTASVHDGTSAVNQQFTGDGSTTAFTLSSDPDSENNTQIYINGVYQQKTDYTVSGTTLTFDTAPTNGDIIEVNSFAVTTLGNTDTVSEGSSNLYHTSARAISAVSAGTLTALTVSSSADQLADFYSTDAEGYIRIRDNNDSLYVSSDTAIGSFGGNVGSHANNLNIDLTNGEVGIGTTAPNANLHVGSSAAVGDASNPAIQIGGTTTYRGGLYTTAEGFILDNNNGDDGISFFTKTNGEMMRLQSDGVAHITSAGAPIAPTIKHAGATGDLAKLRLINRSGQGANKGGAVELGGVTDDGVSRSDVFASIAGLKTNATSANREGYLQFSTSNGSTLAEVARITSSGIHIGGTAAANALDDYEEGTWTPQINTGSLDGNEVGTYTKVGRLVTLQFYINVTTLGSSGSGVLVQNLPFTSANITSGHAAGSVVGRYFTGNDLNLLIPPNVTYIQFFDNETTDFDQVTFGEVEPSYDADFSCYGTITYFAA